MGERILVWVQEWHCKSCLVFGRICWLLVSEEQGYETSPCFSYTSPRAVKEPLTEVHSCINPYLDANVFEHHSGIHVHQVQLRVCSITKLLPSSPMQKHRTVETLTTAGLRFPCILRPSNSFAWKQHWELTLLLESYMWLWCGLSIWAESGCNWKRESTYSAVPHTCYAHSNVRKVRMNFAFYKAFCPALLLQGADGGSICCVHYRARRSGQEIKQTIDMEDPTVLPNLRALNLGQAAKFNSFWEQCARFMNEDVGAAVVFSPEFTGQRAQIISQDHVHHLECSDCQ